jgi:hypothetical protein
MLRKIVLIGLVFFSGSARADGPAPASGASGAAASPKTPEEVAKAEAAKAEAAKAEQAARQREAVAKLIESKDFQLGVWKGMNDSGPQVDACTGRYAEEFPDRKGQAEVIYEIGPEGKVVSHKVNCPLQNSQILVSCLKDVVRRWRFPDVGEAGRIEVKVSIPIAKGQKFAPLKPGEKPPENKSAPTEPQPFNLSPSAFTPTWNSQ